MSVVWQWLEGANWKDQDANVSQQLEQAFQAGPGVAGADGRALQMQVRGRPYLFDVERMHQNNMQTHFRRAIQRSIDPTALLPAPAGLGKGVLSPTFVATGLITRFFFWQRLCRPSHRHSPFSQNSFEKHP